MSLTFRNFFRINIRSLSRYVVKHHSIVTKKYITTGVTINPQFSLHYQLRTLSTRAYSEPCWKCGSTEKTTFFCKKCNSLQKPDENANYFQLLGVNEIFDLDASDLSQKFRQLQSMLHPDKFSNAADEEKKFSADLSSYVNKAFRTLSDPFERGIYLLSLKKEEVGRENTSEDRELLLMIMELNEELLDITSKEELDQFNSRIKGTLKSLEEKVSQSFASEDFTSAKACLMEMKYYLTIVEKIKAHEFVLKIF